MINRNKDAIAHHFIQDFKKKYKQQDYDLSHLTSMRSCIQESDEQYKQYKIKAINELIKERNRTS